MLESLDEQENPQLEGKTATFRNNSRKFKAEKISSGLMLSFGFAGLILCVLVYVLRLDRVSGLFVDDAWYVMLAKALATENSYSLINAPTPGISPLYPPVFPFLLSLLYRISPQFPENIWLLKSLSIVAMLVAGLLAYLYFQRERKQIPLGALGLSLAMTLSPPLVFLATSTVMSECIFTAIFLGTILLVERGVRKIKAGETNAYSIYAALFGICGTICFLTRSASIGVVVAILAYLIMERLYRIAMIFTITVILLSAPWIIYSRMHAPNPLQWTEQAGHIVEDYSKQFWQRQAGNIKSGTIEISDLPMRVIKNAEQVAFRDLLRVIAAPLYESLRSAQAAEAWRQQDGYEKPGGITVAVSLIITLLALTGYIRTLREKITVAEIAVAFSFGIMLLWPWEPFRFLLPLTSLLIYYLCLGVEKLIDVHRQLRQSDFPKTYSVRAILTVVACVLAVSLYGNFNYLSKKLSASPDNQPPWLVTFNENEKLLLWARANLPRQEIIATSNPGLVYLYTGNKTVSFHNPSGNWDLWKQWNVRYLLRTSSFVLPPHENDPEENFLKVVYRQPGALNLRIVDFGEAANRRSWGVINSSGGN